jgi:uncharacterized protein (TIGR03435 family)
VLALLGVLGVTLAAQAPVEFDVASIKRHVGDVNGSSMRGMPDGSMVAVNVPIRSIIGSAYPSQSGEYIGLPDWAQSERYDINVKPPAGTGREQMQEMWRRLLTERMKLVAHDEVTDSAIYNLVLARADGRLGPKLTPSKHDCIAEAAAARGRSSPPLPLTTDADFLDNCGMRVGNGRLISGGFTMERLAQQLRGMAGRVVRDRTGLTGFYVIDFTYALPTATGGPAPSVAVDPNEAVSVFTALQEQLGLKLEPDKMPIQHVVIDHLERPTEN